MLVGYRIGSSKMEHQATARRPKLRVERRPFLAPEVVIFGVDFTGPYILDVKFIRQWLARL